MSPDGRYVALVKPRTSADSDVYLLDTQATEAEARAHHAAYRQRRARRLRLHARQQALVYSTDEHGEFTAGMDLRPRQRRQGVLDLRRLGCHRSSRSPSRAAIASRERTKMRARPSTILDTQAARKSRCRACRQGDLAQIRFSRDETHVALMVSSDTSPNDVYAVDLAAAQRAADAGAEPADQGSRPRRGGSRSLQELRRSRDSVDPVSPAKRHRQRPRCRRSCGCMAGRAGRAAPVTPPRCNISSITATRCWPRTIAARRVTARRSSTWTTSITATST